MSPSKMTASRSDACFCSGAVHLDPDMPRPESRDQSKFGIPALDQWITQWGLLHLTGSTQHAGIGWGDDPAAVLEDRELKHRSKKETRPVPACPPLVRVLRWHLAAYGHATDGRLFFVPTYGNKPVSKWSYANAWRGARRVALTEAQQRSPLAARPYDLRHAAVSLWLNAGVPAPQVAEWAGHSVNVLLKVYAKCIDGQEHLARRRIADALGLPDADRR